jgi:adenosylcobinamide-phosphate synthase
MSTLALGLGYLGDLAYGDPRRGHPVSGFGVFATHLQRLLYRPTRRAGAVYVAVAVGMAATTALLLERGLARLTRMSWVGPSVSVCLAIGGKSLHQEARTLHRLLENEQTSQARARLRALVGRDTHRLSSSEMVRAAIESVAENTPDAVVGPLFWAALFGAPGAWAYRAANTLDAMVGYKCARYERFGWAAARLDDWLTFPAARLASACTVLVSPLVGADAIAARRVQALHAKRHPSPNAGLLEATFAGALGIRLGGANTYRQRLERRPQLGFGPAPGLASLDEATHLAAAAAALSCVVCLAISRARAA